MKQVIGCRLSCVVDYSSPLVWNLFTKNVVELLSIIVKSIVTTKYRLKAEDMEKNKKIEK